MQTKNKKFSHNTVEQNTRTEQNHYIILLLLRDPVLSVLCQNKTQPKQNNKKNKNKQNT